MPKLINRFLKLLLEILEFVLISVTVASLIYLFVGVPLKITGNSMIPTLHDGEQVFSEKLSVKNNSIKRGEILIITYTKQSPILLIKRVIGLPNDDVEIKDGYIFVNDVKIIEPYLTPETKTSGYGLIPNNVKIHVDDGKYLLLGDNRENSSDSREWGPINENLVVGKALFVYLPINGIRLLKGR